MYGKNYDMFVFDCLYDMRAIEFYEALDAFFDEWEKHVLHEREPKKLGVVDVNQARRFIDDYVELRSGCNTVAPFMANGSTLQRVLCDVSIASSRTPELFLSVFEGGRVNG